MRRVLSAKRYAEAAFALAQEQGQVDRWREELARVALALGEPGVVDALQAPGVTQAQRLQVLDGVLPDMDPLVRNLVALLLSRHALSLVPAVADEFQRLMDRQRGVVRAHVRTAVPVTDEERERIAQRLRALVGGDIVMETETDPAILGGFVARVGDKLIDGSLHTRLLQMRQALVQGAA